MNALELDTVLLSPDRTCLEILDQTLLPGEVKTLHLSDTTVDGNGNAASDENKTNTPDDVQVEPEQDGNNTLS